MTAPAQEQDTGVRLYTVAAFKHLEPRSILYATGISRQELLEKLHAVLPQADVVSIRRVREPPMSEPQRKYIEDICRALHLPYPDGWPELTWRQASEFISEKEPHFRKAVEAKNGKDGGGAKA